MTGKNGLVARTYDVPVRPGEDELVIPLHVPLAAQWAPHHSLVTPAPDKVNKVKGKHGPNIYEDTKP